METLYLLVRYYILKRVPYSQGCVIKDESQPVKLIMRALPGIEQFVSQQLAQYTLD
jgi:hypothetical protein